MDEFCKFCGNMHTATDYPKLCTSCEQTTWINPAPVAVLLQPVRNPAGPIGLLLGQRNIEPFIGEWGHVSGFVDMNDADAETAAVRELKEETGLTIAVERVRAVWTYSNRRNLMIFCASKQILNLSDLDAFVENRECSAVDVLYGPRELCFPSHTQAAARWFAGEFR